MTEWNNMNIFSTDNIEVCGTAYTLEPPMERHYPDCWAHSEALWLRIVDIQQAVNGGACAGHYHRHATTKGPSPPPLSTTNSTTFVVKVLTLEVKDKELLLQA